MEQPEDQAEEEDLECEVIPDPYPWAGNADEARRAYIISHMADGDIAGDVLVKNMELVFQWMKDGSLPQAPRSRPKVGFPPTS